MRTVTVLVKDDLPKSFDSLVAEFVDAVNEGSPVALSVESSDGKDTTVFMHGQGGGIVSGMAHLIQNFAQNAEVPSGKVMTDIAMLIAVNELNDLTN